MSYVCLWILVMLLSISDKKVPIRTSKIIIILLILFSGYRYEVGTDYNSYRRIFNDFLIYGHSYANLEYGYGLLNKMIIFIGGDFQLVVLIMALISNVLFYRFIVENSINIIFSMDIFFLIGAYYISGFNGIRQYFTVSLFLWSLRYIKSKEKYKYFITLILGSLIHESILMLLPFYFLFTMRKFKIIESIFFILCTIVVVINFKIILKFIPKYNKYLNLTYAFNTSYVILMCFFILTLVLLYYNQRIKLKSFECNYLIISLCFLIAIFINKFYNEGLNLVLMRVYQYFYFYYIILIPKMFKSLLKKRNLSAYCAYIFFFILMSLLYFRTVFTKLEYYKVNINLFR